jgi:hypothetical protein
LSDKNVRPFDFAEGRLHTGIAKTESLEPAILS